MTAIAARIGLVAAASIPILSLGQALAQESSQSEAGNAAEVQANQSTGASADTDSDAAAESPESDQAGSQTPAGDASTGSDQALPEVVVEAIPQQADYGRDGNYLTEGSTFALGGTQASLKETPFSVSVLDEDFLSDIQPEQLDSVAQYAPGVQQGNQNSNFSQVFQSRGFQLGRDSILINGTQQSDAFAITPTPFVSAVEFYRGPSSVLNGQSPPGGAANIVTKKPLPTPFTRVSGDVNHHGKRQAAIDFNSGQFDIGSAGASFRVNAVGENSQTFRDQVDRDVAAIAPVLTLNFTEQTTLTFEANLIEWQVTDDRGLPLLGGATDEAAERFDESTFLLGTTDKQNDREQQRYMLDFSHRFNEHIKTNFQATYGKTERSFFSVLAGGFNPATNQLTRSHFSDRDELESLDTRIDTLFNFETGFIAHRGIATVQYRQFERTDLAGGFAPNADSVNINNPNPNLPFQASGPGTGTVTEQSSIEGFLQDELRITEGGLEGVRAVLGGRVISFENELNSNFDEDEFVPRLALGYTPPPAEWLTVYGSYSESFNPQQSVTFTGRPLPPQEGEQWEYGAKTEFFDGNLLLSAAYFDLENTNVAVADPNNPTGSVPAGVQENQGFEFEAVGQLTENLQVRGQYTYNDARVTRDPSLAGNALGLTPDHSGSIWLRYDFPSFPGILGQETADRFSVGGGVIYVGDRFVSTNNSIELTNYTRVDVNARYVLNEDTTFDLNIKNVTDERYFTGGNAFGRSVTPGQPFTVGLQLSHRF
jgi:iron complex outermembrane receptor protein